MRRSGKWILGAGLLLLALSLALMALLLTRTDRAVRDNKRLVQTMRSLLPDRTSQTRDPLWNAEMPVLELEGEDYIALLEIPAYGLQLPVGAEWDSREVLSHPCRFWGTAYNGTLIIGGMDQAGQFDFFDRIPDGTAVTVTDMAGRCFSYVVDRVERSQTAESAVLVDEGSDLTLFVRDARFLEYIILRCSHGV